MTSAPQPERPPAPVWVGGYRVLRRLGEGGMGVVHLARRDDGEPVALKVLRPQVVGDREGRERLEREVASLSRVRSPRVAEVLDADPWGDIPFVVTRYVPGRPLHDHVADEGPVAGADLTWFAWCLADALRAVHAAGVLHRDVKPGNVLMEGRSPVLIDFGLARVADDPRLTLSGWLMGTPGYLAPEILHGEDAREASDVHAWAATVAFAGTGRPPFGRGPSMAIMDRVRRGQHDLGGLPAPLRDAVHAALAPDPAARPTLDQLHGWLDGLVRDAPEPAPAPDTVRAPLPRPPADDAPPTRPQEVFPGWGSETGPAPRPRRGAAERVRLAGVLLGVALLLGAAVATAPIPTAAAVGAAVLVLRALATAGGAHRARRVRRGARWFDAPLSLVAAPWHLVASLPMTVVLLLWACGIGAAGMLTGYAVDPTPTTVLGLGGLAGAVGLWLGPGSSRLRRPVDALLRPVVGATWVWLVVLLVVVAAAGALALRAQGAGVDWAPLEGPPLSGLAERLGALAVLPGG